MPITFTIDRAQTCETEEETEEPPKFIHYNWNLGDPSPASVLTETVASMGWVDFTVEATGKELDYLADTFKGLPFHYKNGASRKVTWRGEFAEFIYDNL